MFSPMGDSVSSGAKISVTRTYLAMTEPQALRPSAQAPSSVALRELDPCTVAEARLLYRSVGAAWEWTDRDRWPDDQLRDWLARPEVRSYRLDGPSHELLGYLELVRHPDDSCEIGYFGLVPAAMGRGVGGWFLTEAVRRAWQFALDGRPAIARVWLHTCTLDAPQALPNYLARGFTVTHVEHYDHPRSGPDATERTAARTTS
jgi:GNAT superfamily N-acetyltransferase